MVHSLYKKKSCRVIVALPMCFSYDTNIVLFLTKRTGTENRNCCQLEKEWGLTYKVKARVVKDFSS